MVSAEPLVAAAAEPYGLCKDLPQMSVEILCHPVDLLVFLIRERPGKVYHHGTVTIPEDLSHKPSQNIRHEIMELQRQL